MTEDNKKKEEKLLKQKKVEKLLKTLLGCLQHVTRNQTETEAQNSARLFIQMWKKDSDEAFGENKTKDPFEGFVEWVGKDLSFSDRRGVKHDEIQSFLTAAAAKLREFLPDDEDAVAFAAKVDGYYAARDSAAGADARRGELINAAVLKRTARTNARAGQEANAEVFETELATYMAKRQIGQQEFDQFYRDRELARLALYLKVDLWMTQADEERKEEIRLEILAEATPWGFVSNDSGEASLNDEFIATYQNEYNNDAKTFGAAVDVLVRAYAAQYGADAPSTGGGADAQSAPQRGATKPSKITIYPVRDEAGDVLRYVGAASYADAITAVVGQKDHVAITVDFPLNGWVLPKTATNIYVVQRNEVEGMICAVRHFDWAATQSAMVNCSIETKAIGAVFGPLVETRIAAERGDVTFSGPVQKSSICLASPGDIVAKSLGPIEDSAVTAMVADTEWEHTYALPYLILSGDAASATRTKFVNILPATEEMLKRINEESALPELDGKLYTECEFVNVSGSVAGRDLARSTFSFDVTALTAKADPETREQLKSNFELFISGDNTDITFDNVGIDVTLVKDASFAGSTTKKAFLTVNSTGDEQLDFSGGVSEDGCLTIGDIATVSLMGRKFRNNDLNIAKVDKLDLRDVGIEGKDLSMENVWQVNAERARAADCRISLKKTGTGSAPPTEVKFILAGGEVSGCEINLEGVHTLDLTGAVIVGDTKISGSIKHLIADGAQIGASFGEAGTVMWSLTTETASIAGMTLGNADISQADGFGKTSDAAAWKDVSVIGAVSMSSEAVGIFDLLSNARNLDCERPAGPGKAETIAAKVFNL